MDDAGASDIEETRSFIVTSKDQREMKKDYFDFLNFLRILYLYNKVEILLWEGWGSTLFKACVNYKSA